MENGAEAEWESSQFGSPDWPIRMEVWLQFLRTEKEQSSEDRINERGRENSMMTSVVTSGERPETFVSFSERRGDFCHQCERRNNEKSERGREEGPRVRTPGVWSQAPLRTSSVK